MDKSETKSDLNAGVKFDLGEKQENDDEDGEDFTDQDEKSIRNWTLFGNNVPKPEIIFFAQVVIIYVVVITSLINISIGNGDTTIWLSLTCGCLGYMLPNPSLPSEEKTSIIDKRFS